MAITNGGFDSASITGWTEVNVPSTTFLSSHTGGVYTYAPVGGSYFVQISTSYQIEGTFNALTQDIAFTAGEVLSGYAAFDNLDGIDIARIRIMQGATLIATPWEVEATSTDWTLWSWTAPSTDTYTLRLEVANVFDSSGISYALFDSITISSPPPVDPPGQGVATVEGQGWWSGVGAGFKSEANRSIISGAGGSFESIAAGTMYYGNVGEGVGNGFNSTVAGLGGAVGVGNGFSSTVAGVMINQEYWYGKGYGFSSTAAGVLNVTVLMSGKGAGFSSKATGLGGAIGVGNGFKSVSSGTMLNPERITGKGGGFYSTANGVVVVPAFAYGVGGGFSSVVWHATGQGGSFSSTVTGSFLSTLINAEALVMNMTPNSAGQYPVTRFTNYPFNNIVKLGANYYGVKDDGFYLLSGDLDITTAVNGKITLKDTDFGVYQEKRLQYVYLNTDTVTTTVPFVDGVQKPGVASLFGGRRCKLPLGDRGRYWQLRIENIKKLEGIEFNPVGVQRKV